MSTADNTGRFCSVVPKKNALNGLPARSNASNEIICHSRDFPAKSMKGSLKCTFNYVVFLLAFIMCFRTIDAAPSEAKVCQSESCQSIATSIKQKMNQNADPCEDFYEFVCGNFSRNAEISPSRSFIDVFTQLADVVQSKLKNNIENQITHKDPETFHKLYRYYKYCMDEERIERSSRKIFLGYLKKFGGWPVLLGKSYDDSKFDWKDTIKKISRTGYAQDQIVGVYIDIDERNNTRNLIHLDQAGLGISQEYLLQGFENDVVQAYFKYMVDLAEIFGADRERAERELSESLDFEIELAEISLSMAIRILNVERMYNPTTISELQSRYPYISWLNYLNDLLSPHHRLDEDEEVIVKVPIFFERLGDLLARTPKRVLANYLMWRVTQESAEYLDKKVRDARLEFRAVLTGNRNDIPRWQTCVKLASKDLYVAASALYVRRNFNKAAKDRATAMVSHLRQSFRDILSEVDWMDEATRSAAIRKLDQMKEMIAYHDELLDDEKINEFYKGLKLCPKSYLTTGLFSNRFHDVKKKKKFRDLVFRDDWTDRYAAGYTVNAYYYSIANIMQFPAAVLQGELYSEDNPKYVNYASIGSVIGHEITHGFDDDGRKFDDTGNLVDWWQSDTKAEFLRRAQCIVDQYSDFMDPDVGLSIDGRLTRNENIADNGGLKEAYLAYSTFEKENGEEPVLPGFEGFTPRQNFWISYGNIWCSRYREEFLQDVIRTNEHPPSRFRLIGTVMNSPDFAKDFNCPAGSPMNPEERCTVW